MGLLTRYCREDTHGTWEGKKEKQMYLGEGAYPLESEDHLVV